MSPRYRTRDEKCQAATGATVSRMNRTRTQPPNWCELDRAADQRFHMARNREVASSHIVAGVHSHRATIGLDA